MCTLPISLSHCLPICDTIRMRPGHSIFILSLIALAIIIAGCTDNSKPGETTPSPTAAPNVTATPTALPDISGTIHSSQVRLVSLNITPVSTSESQRGNINIILENVGNNEVGNLSANLVLIDMKTLERLYDVNYTLDMSIPAYGNNTYTLVTGMYGPDTESLDIKLHIYWGDRNEFWNAYNMTRPLPWIEPGGY
jgi:hypothetical protein